jgi:hypothetical protein
MLTLAYKRSTLTCASYYLETKRREQMVRELNNLDTNFGFFSNAYDILWMVFVTFCIISSIIFSCAGGVSKERNSVADAESYGAGCGVGCGA